MIRIIYCIFAAAMCLGMSVHLYAGLVERELLNESTDRTAILDVKIEGWKRFRVEFDQTIAAVTNEGLPLEKAVEQVIQASRQHFPDFLENARVLKKRTLQCAVAQTIVQHFVHAPIDASRSLAPIVERLRAEQVKLYGESDESKKAQSQVIGRP